MNSYLDVALQLGVIFALLGIIWNCIQMVFGTMEQRKFLVDTITKWFLFLFILVIYPGASKGLRNFSIQMASYVSSTSIDDIANEFGQYMETLEKALAKEIADQDKLIKDIKQKQEDSSFDIYNSDYMHWDEGGLQSSLYSAEKRREELELNLNSDNPKGKAKTLNAIRSVLTIDDKSITKKYTIDLSMKDANDMHTGYLSPNAMLRMSVLSAQIMWQKVWEEDVLKTWEEDKQKGFLIKDKGIFDFPFRKIWDILLCFLSEIMIVVITCMELVQYVMCIIEFIVCITFGIVLIPCMLFDPLKDMSSKLLPSLLSQSVKLSMITICMYFCCYTYLDMAKTTIANTAGFTLWDFCYVVFTCLLTMALCSNAPKLASALLTGQPQMSMGEFVQAAGAIAGGAALASKGVELGRKGVGASARATANRLGDAAAIGGGMKQGFANGSDGKSGFKGLMSGIGGAITGGGKVTASRTGQRIKSGLQNMANYRGKGSGGGTGGSGGGVGGLNRFGVLNPDGTAHSDVALENEKSYEKERRNTMNYGSHNTETGAKSTLGEYLRSQAESGKNVVGNKTKPMPPSTTGSGNSGGGKTPPMPPSVPPSFGSHVSFSPKMRNVTPKPEALPPSGLPSPGKKKISDGKNNASDVNFNIS